MALYPKAANFMSKDATQIDALILRSYPSGDSDNVYRLLTLSEGKISAIAKGVRRSKKRFSSLPEPFDIGQAELRKGRGDLQLLNGFLPKRTLLPLRESLLKFQMACTICEAFDSLIHEEDQEHSETLFHIASDCLEAISDAGSEENLHQPASFSLRKLLRVTGYLEDRSQFEQLSPEDEWKWITHRIEEIIERPLRSR